MPSLWGGVNGASPLACAVVGPMEAEEAEEAVAANAGTATAKRCLCHDCMREVLAVECANLELECPNCSGTCVELLEAQAPPPSPAPPGLAPQHLGVICDGCQARDFAGPRYRCSRCPDFDLCEACHAQRDVIHPNHSFEAITVPRPPVLPAHQSRVVPDAAGSVATRTISHTFTPTVITILEIGMDDDDASQTGLDDSQVAWWLAADERLADVERVAAQSPKWACAICSEGLEAEDSNGWVVRICGDVARPGAGESEGHIYHEGCLRRWLVKRNACPVCRRSPVVPVD